MISVPKDLSKLSINHLHQLEHDLDYDRTMCSVLEQAKKVTANSCYGALGNQYFRHFDVRLGEAVTLTGQIVIQFIQSRVNEFLNREIGIENKEDYVVASDTDSIYVRLGHVVEHQCQSTDHLAQLEFINDFCASKLQPEIDRACSDIADMLNAYRKSFAMKREVIADKGIWKKKKHYILNVWDKEGVRYDDPKLKIMGIEIVKSSTPMVCREHLKEAVKIIVRGTEEEVQLYAKNFKMKFMKLPVEDIACPRGVSNIDKFETDTGFEKGTPIHSKGSIVYNRLLVKHDLVDRYQTIKEGEKIKFIYLKEPNPAHDKVISFPEVLPKEFELERFIDRELQFEKVFAAPLQSILNTIGWSLKRRSNLMNMFNRGK